MLHNTTTRTTSVVGWLLAMRVLFFGTDAFAAASLRRLAEALTGRSPRSSRPPTAGCNPSPLQLSALEVVCPPLRPPRRRGPPPPPPAVRLLAEDCGLRVHDYEAEAMPALVAAGGFEVGVVASFGKLLPAATVTAFPRGMLNVHPSLLPRHRGPAPIAHTVLAGDAETGISIIELSIGRFDAGRLLRQVRCAVPPRATTASLTAHLAELGAGVLCDTLHDLEACQAAAVPQDSRQATQAPKLSPTLRAVAVQTTSAEDIDRLHRALPPVEVQAEGLPTVVQLPDLRLLARGPPELAALELPQRLRESIQDQPVGTMRFYKHAFSLGDGEGEGEGDGSVDWDRGSGGGRERRTMSSSCSGADGPGPKRRKVGRPAQRGGLVLACREGWLLAQTVQIPTRKPLVAAAFANGYGHELLLR